MLPTGGLSADDNPRHGPGGLTIMAEQVNPRLVMPPLPPRHIARPRLLAALDGSAGTPLVLLAAGPGTGKTVLLADWALAQKSPVGWINLTPADAAPRRFWPLLCSALRACTGLDEFAPTAAAYPTMSAVQSLLASMSGFAVPPILVVDDAQVLTHPAVLENLDLIIRCGPPRLRLVLASRSDPLLPVHRYRLAGLMCELRARELAMTRGEVRELLLAHGVVLPPEDVDALLARTEGWVAGLRLSAMRMEGTEHPVRFLTELARKNSFVVPLDPAHTRFRYHQLFAEVLRHDVQRRERSSVPGLMQRAGAHFERIGNFRDALYWAATSGNSGHAAALLARGGLAHALVHREDLSDLNLGNWQAPPPSAAADAAQAREAAIADSAVVAVMADAAARELPMHGLPVDEELASPELLVTAGLVRLLLGMNAGDVRAVDEAADYLLTRSDDTPGYRVPGLAAAVMLVQATTQFWHGRNEDVGTLLQAALKEAECEGPPVLELNVLAMIALVDSLLPRPRRAEEAALRAHSMLREHGSLSPPLALELAAAGRSLIAADLTGAAQALERARAPIPNNVGADPGLVAARAIGQATLFLASGDLNEARAVMNRTSSRTDLPLLRLLRETLLADIETLLGRPNAALSLLRDYRDGDLSVLTALPRASRAEPGTLAPGAGPSPACAPC